MIDPSCTPSEYVGTMDLWARLDETKRQKKNMENPLTYRLDGLRNLAKAGKAHRSYLVSLVTDWEDAITKSGAIIADPLLIEFASNRWLAASREEAYSDWLAWILEQITDPSLVAELLFGLNSTEFAIFSGRRIKKIDREVWVPEGYTGSAGRLDCVLRFADALIVIEIKKFHDEGGATYAKHEGYANWLNRQSEATHLKLGLIIAHSPETSSVEDLFRYLDWRTVCQRGRSIIPKVCKSGEKGDHSKNVVIASLLATFIGSVEQNILMIPSISSLKQGYVPAQEYEKFHAHLKGGNVNV